MELNFVRRKCDYCGDTQEFSQAKLMPADAPRLASWALLVRMFLIGDEIRPVQLHACKDSCAVNIIKLGQLDLPQEVKDAIEQQRRLEAERLKAMADGLPKKAPLQFAGVEIPKAGFPVRNTGQEIAEEIAKHLPDDVSCEPAGQASALDHCNAAGLIPITPVETAINLNDGPEHTPSGLIPIPAAGEA